MSLETTIRGRSSIELEVFANMTLGSSYAIDLPKEYCDQIELLQHSLAPVELGNCTTWQYLVEKITMELPLDKCRGCEKS